MAHSEIRLLGESELNCYVNMQYSLTRTGNPFLAVLRSNICYEEADSNVKPKINTLKVHKSIEKLTFKRLQMFYGPEIIFCQSKYGYLKVYMNFVPKSIRCLVCHARG